MNLTLSRLAYEAVKESISNGGSDLSYDSFTRQDDTYLGNQDYVDRTESVWGGINTALARLSEYEKLAPFVEQAKLNTDTSPRYQWVEVPKNAKEVKNVFYFRDGGSYKPLRFSIMGGKVILEGLLSEKTPVCIEYTKSFPHYSKEDIVPTLAIGETDPVTGKVVTEYTDRNIDLGKEFNLSSEAFEFAKKMAMAEIVRLIDPNRYQDLIQLAENYYADLPTYRPTHRQRNIGHTFGF